MKPLSFCLITTFYPPHHFGGDAIFVERLAAALTGDGHSVEVIYDSDAFNRTGAAPRSSDHLAAAVVEDIGRGAIGRMDLLAVHQLGRPVLKQREIHRLLSERKFDVVHFHNVSLLGGPAILGEGTGVRLCTLHDYWFVCAMHVLWRYEREACTKRTCIRCTLRGGRPVQWWRYGGSARRQEETVDAFITGSQFSKAAHIANGFHGPIEVIPHFVPDHEPPSEAPQRSEPIRPFVLYAGRLERLKGIADLVRFFRTYRNIDLLIAGSGSLEDELRGEIRELGHVRLLGWRNETELRALYAQALAAVVPSLCYETFGLSAAEAFSNGAPAVMRDIGALTELAGGGALLYRTDSDLEAHLEMLRSDPTVRDRLGQAARDQYEREFAAEIHLRKYYALIERVASKSRTS